MSRGPDQKIISEVQLKLAKRGLRSPSSVTVSSKNGEVVLTGSVQYAHQKSAAVQTATGVTGVKRVIDQMTIGAKRTF
jgi:osmotically-inducible protein OsmY